MRRQATKSLMASAGHRLGLALCTRLGDAPDMRSTRFRNKEHLDHTLEVLLYDMRMRLAPFRSNELQRCKKRLEDYGHSND